MKDYWPKDERNFQDMVSESKIKINAHNELQQAFLNYSEKYKDSAHVITEHILRGQNNAQLDMFFFAIAFLYRHSLELALKSIAFKYLKEDNERKEFVRVTHHNLLEIFDTIFPYLSLQFEKDEDGYNWLRAFLVDINSLDKESDSFRYPYSIKCETNEYFPGEKHKTYSIDSIIKEQMHINLVSFANKMEVAYGMIIDLISERYGSNTDYQEYIPKLLETGGVYYGQSVVGYSYDKAKYHPFVYSYLETAGYLYSVIKSNEEAMKDKHFLPMCYLYRNGIELSLKETLFEECSFDFQDALKHIHTKKHKIFGLWELIKDEVIEHGNAPAGDSTIETVDKYLSQLHGFDSDSSIFRYPVNKHLNYYFKNPKYLDIDNVNDFFLEITSFLSAINSMMNHHNDIKREMEYECRSEWESNYDHEYY